MLAVLEDFEGWERGADWNDLDFMLSHGDEIAKIAIVGESRWETQALPSPALGFARAGEILLYWPARRGSDLAVCLALKNGTGAAKKAMGLWQLLQVRKLA